MDGIPSTVPHLSLDGKNLTKGKMMMPNETVLIMQAIIQVAMLLLVGLGAFMGGGDHD